MADRTAAETPQERRADRASRPGRSAAGRLLLLLRDHRTPRQGRTMARSWAKCVRYWRPAATTSTSSAARPGSGSSPGAQRRRSRRRPRPRRDDRQPARRAVAPAPPFARAAATLSNSVARTSGSVLSGRGKSATVLFNSVPNNLVEHTHEFLCRIAHRETDRRGRLVVYVDYGVCSSET